MRAIMMFVFSCLLLSPIAVTAAEPTARLLVTLKKRFPATQFDTVTRSPIPGLFEVVMGPNTVYTDVSGRYFLFGNVFDTRTQQDLTVRREAPASRVAFSALPLADAIRTVKGTGARVFAVFTDPDCAHCQRLENDLESLDNVTIYRFLVPLQDVPDGHAKVRSVWCATDREGALASLRAGTGLPPASCDDPAARNVGLMQKLHLPGTPALIAADGRTQIGALPAPELLAWLDTAPVAPVSKPRLSRKTTKD
jgi:thiol:disulfide interchange protein DsbC